MDMVTRYRAMAAFCRQQAILPGEEGQFWLSEAEIWEEKLSERAAAPGSPSAPNISTRIA